MSQHIIDYFKNGEFVRRVVKIKQDNKNFRCKSCEYIWETRKKIGCPLKCPRCNSKNFEEYCLGKQEDIEEVEDKPIFECEDCEHLWGIGGGNKNECPKCKGKSVIVYKNEEEFSSKREERQSRILQKKIDEAVKKLNINQELYIKPLIDTEWSIPSFKGYAIFKEKKPIMFIWIDKLKNIFLEFQDDRGIKSFYSYSKKDKLFMDEWEIYKGKLLKRQKNQCFICKKEISLKGSTLHHQINWKGKQKGKEEEIKKKVLNGEIFILTGFKEIEEVELKMLKKYRELKDTILICQNCHFLEHIKRPF
jgi:hypothetical protein